VSSGSGTHAIQSSTVRTIRTGPQATIGAFDPPIRRINWHANYCALCPVAPPPLPAVPRLERRR